MAETIYQLAAAMSRLDPALYTQLLDEHNLGQYLEGFDEVDELAEQLPANATAFMEDILEQDFPAHWLLFHETGIIRYELINICAACEQTLLEFGWPDADDSMLLRYAVITAISDYLTEGGSGGL